MESDLQKARALCRRYFDATATEAEELELRRLLATLPREALDGELRSAAVMMGGFEALARESLPRRTAATGAPKETDDRAAGTLSGPLPRPTGASRRPHRRWNLLLGTGAGIAAALLVGLFFLTRGTVYGYIDGRPVTDPAEAMCATAYFQPLEELSRSFDIADRLLEAAEKRCGAHPEQQ